MYADANTYMNLFFLLTIEANIFNGRLTNNLLPCIDADRVKEKKNKKIILPIDTSNTSGTAEAIQAAVSDDDYDKSALSDYGDDTDLSASLPESSEGYAAAVEQLNKAEENLLACHITSLEKNAQMCGSTISLQSLEKCQKKMQNKHED